MPFLTWDTAYVFLRPHSFPDGKYAAYFKHMVEGAEVDHLYGKDAWLSGDGVIVAQSLLAMLEATLYMIYVGLVIKAGGIGSLLKRQRVGGRDAARAVLIGFAAGVVSATKTIHYRRLCGLSL